MVKLKSLKVSHNKRFLVTDEDKPFFWLGDTAWELFHKLSREEADLYLENRAARGFNVIQAVALGEDDGIESPNFYGRRPLKKNSNGLYDPEIPDTEGENSYWNNVDYIVDKASSLGLYIGLLPTWGDKYTKIGKGPIVFNEKNAFTYGEWLGLRYKDKTGIIWVLGGDRKPETRRHFNIINSMAEGLRAGDGGCHLITFHPDGTSASSKHVHEEDWLDFNMIQSGHFQTNLPNYNLVKSDYDLLPVKPTLDAEPRYEDHPIGFNPINGYFDDFDVRQAAYWAVLAGAFGHTYGHNSIWIMRSEPSEYYTMTWKDAILRPGAWQMQYLRKLIEARPLLERIPDQELLSNNYEGANHLQASRGESYAFIYSPYGLEIKVNMGRITGKKIKAYWYDPRNGLFTFIGEYKNEGIASFYPPTHGRSNDWVLVLDDYKKEYKIS